ncbi:MAG: hypothetical protein IJ859_01370 [Synergistaceae bacterium]|nr:hypothetical protein [Synergistaceae bacterium]
MPQTLVEAIKPSSSLEYIDDDGNLCELDPIEAEVDAIRQQIWEETKNMTSDERITNLIRRTAPIIKQYNMKVSTLKPVEPRKRQRDIWDDD